MPTKLRLRPCAFLSVAAVLLAASPSFAASWQNNKSYGGSGPTMDLYVPDMADASPGAIVILHYCGGNSGATHGWLQGLSDQHGFLIIAPSVGAGKNCWNATPTRSGELASIVQMVDFVANEEGVDRTKVFAAGASSGACMTNALLAAYPEIFAGGSVLAGVPAGAWMGGNTCGSCGMNPPNRTAQQWGDLVRNASPSFMGTRPRVQLWHGTSDNTLNYPNLAAEVLQWTNVLGVTDQDATMQSDQPKSGWNRTSYGKDGAVVLEAIIGQGQPHDLTGLGLWPDVVRFFRLDMDTPPGSGGTGGMGGSAGAAGSGASGASGGGGVSNAGGTASGGSAGDGGTVNAGGASASGGMPATGGVSTAGAGSGGVSAGGAGMTSTGGSVSTGGAMSTGGASATGGTAAAGTGGGLPGTGGSTGGGSGDVDSSSSGGCSVSGGADRPFALLVALAAAGCGWLARRRRRV